MPIIQFVLMSKFGSMILLTTFSSVRHIKGCFEFETLLTWLLRSETLRALNSFNMENCIQYDGFTTKSNQVKNSEFRLKMRCCFRLVFSVRVCRAAVVAITSAGMWIGNSQISQ